MIHSRGFVELAFEKVANSNLALDWAQKRDWVENFYLVQTIWKGLCLADDWGRL